MTLRVTDRQRVRPVHVDLYHDEDAYYRIALRIHLNVGTHSECCSAAKVLIIMLNFITRIGLTPVFVQLAIRCDSVVQPESAAAQTKTANIIFIH